MPKQNNKSITLNDLANMVAKGFEGVDNRFNDIEQRMATKEDLNELRHGLSKLGVRVDEIYEIVSNLEEMQILDLQNRVRDLEKSVKIINKHLIK